MKVSNRDYRVKDSFYDYVLVFWLIFTSGIITLAYNNFLFFLLGTCVILFNFLTRPIRTDQIPTSIHYTFILLECITFVHFIITVIDGHVFYGSVKMFLIFLLCYFCCIRFSLKLFCSIFSNIIVLIAAFSVVLYWFNNEIVASGIFPVINYDNETTYSNLVVYCVNPSILHRNCGVFWEPGAFQVYLNLALLFVLHDVNTYRRGLKIAILIIALLTTISTMGYVCAALILISYFLRVDLKKKAQALIISFFIFVIAGSLIIPIAIESFSYKFGLETGEVSGSVTSRVNPFMLDLHLISYYPFGLPGVDYYAELLKEYSVKYNLPYISSSCTITMVSAVYGLIPGIILTYGITLFGRHFFGGKYNWIISVALILMFTTESFLIFPLFYFLAFYGYKKNLYVKL